MICPIREILIQQFWGGAQEVKKNNLKKSLAGPSSTEVHFGTIHVRPTQLKQIRHSERVKAQSLK
jgi:hypothetical protein